MGICLICGFLTPNLDILDEHTAQHELRSRRIRARSLWASYGYCIKCGAGPGHPCRTFPGDYVSCEPHVIRPRIEEDAA